MVAYGKRWGAFEPGGLLIRRQITVLGGELRSGQGDDLNGGPALNADERLLDLAEEGPVIRLVRDVGEVPLVGDPAVGRPRAGRGRARRPTS